MSWCARQTAHARRTGFVIIDPFVEGKPGIKHFVDLVRVLDIIAYLAFDDACRVDEPGKDVRHACAFEGDRVCARTAI
jgi:hypothetical protein